MAEIFSAYLLPATLVIIMMGMGLSLELQDFRNVIRYPKSVLIGIFCQVLVLPSIAFLLFGFLDISPYIKVGFIIITACAGGAATNLITYLMRGNVALSISLTAINSIIILFSLPLIVNLSLHIFLGEDRSIHLPFLNTFGNIIITMIIPTIIGMTVRRHYWRFAIQMEKPLKIIMPTLLLTSFIVIIFFDNDDSNKQLHEQLFLFPYALLLNFVSMTVIYIIARISKLGGKNNFTLSIEVGLKNSIIGIFVAKTLLDNHDMAMVSVAYGTITFFSTLLFGYIAKRIEIGLQFYRRYK